MFAISVEAVVFLFGLVVSIPALKSFSKDTYHYVSEKYFKKKSVFNFEYEDADGQRVKYKVKEGEDLQYFLCCPRTHLIEKRILDKNGKVDAQKCNK